MGLKNGQMKIQQMAFMIVGVFFFFILVGLFFVQIQFKDIGKNVKRLNMEQAISSLKVIADMPELNCGSSDSICVDEDKLQIMSGKFGDNYENFWPVASVKVYKIYPSSDRTIKCPKPNCNYYEIFDNGQSNVEEYSTFVSICKKVREYGSTYDKCEIGKLVVGAKIYEKEG